jgi:hypothetical protein
MLSPAGKGPDWETKIDARTFATTSLVLGCQVHISGRERCWVGRRMFMMAMNIDGRTPGILIGVTAMLIVAVLSFRMHPGHRTFGCD